MLFLKSIILFFLICIYIVAIIFFKKRRLWLFYYITASFGLTLNLSLLFGILNLDDILRSVNSFLVSGLARFLFGIPVHLSNSSNLFLRSSEGLSILIIGVECSAIFEMAALLGLVIFYPAFSLANRVLKSLIGLILTFILNILRMIVMLLIVYSFGRNSIFFAHAIVGRLFFFVGVVAIFWFILTKPTVRAISGIINKNRKCRIDEKCQIKT